MSQIEFLRRFGEARTENENNRSPAVVVIEFGGGSCNKANAPSCRDFCAVPNGKIYNPFLDPSPKMLKELFPQVAKLRPAVVSIVPNGEGVDTLQQSNTSWNEVIKLKGKDDITQKQFHSLVQYCSEHFDSSTIEGNKKMSVAEKMALTLALAKNAGLNLSLTTNGSFLTKDLLELYGKMGLQSINLSYHPDKPFDPNGNNQDLKHLIAKARESIDVDIIPTITHVLTSRNASTFVALADFVTEHDIFFSVGIANARGGAFSTGVENQWIEPTDTQLKIVFLRLLARKLFADRSIRTTIPYLLLAPSLNKSWICDQTTDFFHISVERINGKLQPNLNVCSEVRPNKGTQLIDFISKGKIDTKSYLKWREEEMRDSKTGCKTCIHQCFFEAEARGGVNFSNPLLPVEIWDYWDTVGKGLRQKYTFRKPIRPILSHKNDFLNPYLWESLLQGVARQMAKLVGNTYWQETFKRSNVSYETTLASSINDAFNNTFIQQLIAAEQKDRNGKSAKNWHDASYIQSKLFRLLYLSTQKSGQEGKLPIPLKFKGVLKHESQENLPKEIEQIVLFERKKQEKATIQNRGTIYPFVGLVQKIFSNLLVNFWPQNLRYT
ncbi:MAG: hypothetical protein G01um101493_157 [Microgenomates group bacterium Gr01-1014_93]|nr:MAG: hypothetical protein G01um101493_157 [Microgenomates group bacterium Gr01-1014_93]